MASPSRRVFGLGVAFAEGIIGEMEYEELRILRKLDPRNVQRRVDAMVVLKSSRARVGLLLMLLTVILPFPMQADEPSLLYLANSVHGGPIWVPADLAFGSDGEIEEELFPGPSGRMIRSLIETPVDPEIGCIPVTELYQSIVNPDDRSTLDKALQTSSLVAWAEVIGVSEGFHWGFPSTLVEASVTEILKGKTSVSIYFLPYPVGKIQAGDAAFCSQDNRVPRVPAVGDEVLVLIPSKQSPDEEFLDQYTATSYITVSDEGISYPREFQDSVDRRRSKVLPVTAEELRSHVQVFLGGQN